MSNVSSVEIPFITVTGISVSDSPISDLADPVNLQDAATKNFTENASNITKGVLAIEFGGTGGTTASGARTALGVAASGANNDITSLTGLTTTLSVGQGGTGLNAVPGSSGRLLMNSSGAYAAAGLLSYNGTDTLTVGTNDSTFTITAASHTTNQNSGGNLVIKGGLGNSQFTNQGTIAGNLTLAGGDTISSAGRGGDVFIRPGLGSTPGAIYLQTGTSSMIERLRITSTGAWGFGGANYGTNGQVLMSGGSDSAPTWQTLSGLGTVTSVEVSGGTTGLTTSGGPITASGTITLSGTLAITNGGTGATTAGAARSNLSAAASGANSDITSLSGLTTALSIAQGGTGAATKAAAMNALSPTTTKGDIIVFNGTNNVRLAAGSDGQVLAADSTTTEGVKWAAGGGNGTVTSIAVSGGTTGLTVTGSPITSSGTITLAGTLAVANGGTGRTTVPGATTQLIYNSSGTLTGSNSLTYNGTDQLTVGGAPFKIAGTANSSISITAGSFPGGAGAGGGAGGSINITGGTSVYNQGGSVTITGGTGALQDSGFPSAGGDVTLKSGSGVSGNGSLYFNIVNTERLRIVATGAFGLSGANYGTTGQVLTSNGSGSAPTWTTISAGSGTVTSVAISGGTTGLTTSGGPVTSSGTITLAGTLAVANGGTGATTAAGARTNLGAVNIAGDTMTGTLTLVADPTAALQAATKQYVDNVASGLNVHAACRTATTTNLTATYSNGTSGVGATLTGTGSLPTIGDVTLATNDRVLVKDQTTGSENGVYVVTTTTGNWVLTRATDFDGNPAGEITAGDTVYIQEGDSTGTQWVMNTTGSVTVGTTSLAWTQFGGPGSYSAGTGISLANNVISNTGVTSLAAGTNISVTGSTGAVTVAFSGTLPVTSGGTGQTSFASGYLKSDGTALSSSSTISGADVSGNISGNAANVTGTVAIANGGTGATTASDARTALGTAASGANSDITSITGLTTALSIAQGGTGATTAANAATNILPVQSGNNGKVLSTDGAGNLNWILMSTGGALDFGTFAQPAGFSLDMGTF